MVQALRPGLTVLAIAFIAGGLLPAVDALPQPPVALLWCDVAIETATGSSFCEFQCIPGVFVYLTATAVTPSPGNDVKTNFRLESTCGTDLSCSGSETQPVCTAQGIAGTLGAVSTTPYQGTCRLVAYSVGGRGDVPVTGHCGSSPAPMVRVG